MKEFNFKELYQNNYKKLPNLVFWTNLIILFCGAITGAVFCFIAEADGWGLLVLIGGFFVAWGLAYLDALFCAVIISHKIVATDALLEISVNSKIAISHKNEDYKNQNKKGENTYSYSAFLAKKDEFIAMDSTQQTEASSDVVIEKKVANFKIINDYTLVCNSCKYAQSSKNCEYMSLAEAAIFEYAFKLGMQIAIETLTE